MKVGPLFRKIFYSSAFLATIPAVIILLFFHPSGTKFMLTMRPESSHHGQFLFSDLNSDSIPEAVFTGKAVPYYYVGVKSSTGNFFDQWNLEDSINSSVSDLFFGNFDNDNNKEIYVFTHKGDSLYLNVNEMLEPGGTKMNHLYITQIGYINREVTSILYPVGFFDQNEDGKDEMYFGITSGFRADPRRVYCYDLVNRKLTSSPFTGIICMNPKMLDLDGNNRPEIFGTLSACGNYGKSVPYSDSSTWFMVLNDSLKFEFPPVEFPGYVNGLETEGYKNESFRGYVLSHLAMGVDTNAPKSRIIISSVYGNEVRHKLYSDFGLDGYIKLFVVNYGSSDKIYLLKDKFYELNDNLDLLRTVNLPFNTPIITYQFDINNDKINEFLIYSEIEEKLVVLNASLGKMAELKVKIPVSPWRISKFLTGENLNTIFIKAADLGFYLDLKRNDYRFLGYIVYPGVYIVVLLFILLIKRINTLQVVQKESLNRRLVTLQLQGIKSQLDPHFTFNTLNSIASLIYLEDRELAYDYMNKFTQLLRSLLNDAERIYRSLSEEIDFVTTYLDLEKLRFGEKFNYDISIDENVNRQIKVPKLVLQTFAENAIKHGIMSCTGVGILKIKAERKGDYLILSIEDNGIGRAKAEGQSLSTGKGLRLASEFYDILNQLNKMPIHHSIIDLYNEEGEASGTKVEVWVPVE